MQNIDLSKPACLLFVGSKGRGKTNALRYIILKNSLDNFPESAKFEFGICFTRTSYNSDYNFLPSDHVYSGYDEEVHQKYLAALEEQIAKGKEVPPNFIIFDDLIGLLSKNNPFLTNAFSIMRHTNTYYFLATQHLKTGANTTLRELCDYAIVFNSKATNTIVSLYENVGQLFENVGDFKRNFWDITKEPYTAMLYMQNVDNIDDNYMCYKAPDTSNWNYQLDY